LTYTDLTTVGPAVTATIGSSGKAVVILTAGIANNTDDTATFMGFAISGATTRAAADATALRAQNKHDDINQRSATYFVTGLTAGSNTFTAKYRQSTVMKIGTFVNRTIMVIPVP